MTFTRRAALFAFALFLLGCGTPASRFVGEYEITWTSALQDVETLERVETGPVARTLVLTEENGIVRVVGEPCLDFMPSGSSAELVESTCDAGDYDQDGRGAGYYGTITVMDDGRIYGMWRVTRHYHDDLHYEDWTVSFDGRRR
jgi:hypothetical protein